MPQAAFFACGYSGQSREHKKPNTFITMSSFGVVLLAIGQWQCQQC